MSSTLNLIHQSRSLLFLKIFSNPYVDLIQNHQQSFTILRNSKPKNKWKRKNFLDDRFELHQNLLEVPLEELRYHQLLPVPRPDSAQNHMDFPETRDLINPLLSPRTITISVLLMDLNVTQELHLDLSIRPK